MKRHMVSVLGIGILSVMLVGCESMNDTGKGAAVGGLLGATAGGIIGNQGGHGWEGALIGGASGAVLGGLVGNQMDKHQMEVNPNHIPLTKIAEMANSGTPDAVIISEIDRTHSKYDLNSELIDYLKQNKVGDKVIDHMLATGKS